METTKERREVPEEERETASCREEWKDVVVEEMDAREERERKTYLLRGNGKRARAINVKNVALVLWIKNAKKKKKKKKKRTAGTGSIHVLPW